MSISMVESLMVEHSRLHHKGHNARDNKQSPPLQFSSLLSIRCLHLFHHNYYKCDKHVQLNPSVKIPNLEMYLLYDTCPKWMVETLMIEHKVHQKGILNHLRL